MTSEKQIKSNKQNALQSTGPKTPEGKAIISNNAVKHGIFAKDIVIASGEDAREYQELLENLIQNLKPQGQMACILVEKIAVDFWRLKRVLRFETGNIRQYLDTVITEYYQKSDFYGVKDHKTNDEIDSEIVEKKELMDWNNRYIQVLAKGTVSFDEPVWQGEDLESDIEDNLFLVADALKEKIFDEFQAFQYDKGLIPFKQLKEIFKKAGYSDQDIAKELIECLKKQNADAQEKIQELEQEKIRNKFTEELSIKICSLPAGENAEKAIKYEKALQRSIIQNFGLLKRIQANH